MAPDNDWMTIGVECIYRKKLAFLFIDKYFRAEILGFTATGRVRIRAYSSPENVWYKATVERSALRPINNTTNNEVS